MFAREKRTVKQREEDIYYAIVANSFAYNMYECVSFNIESQGYCLDVFNAYYNPYLRKDEKFRLDLTQIISPLKNNIYGDNHLYYEFYLDSRAVYYDTCGFTFECRKLGRTGFHSRIGTTKGIIAYDTTTDHVLFLGGYGFLEKNQEAFIDSTFAKDDIINYIKFRYIHMDPKQISLDSIVYYPTKSAYDTVFIYTSFYNRYIGNKIFIKMHYESPKTWLQDTVIEDPSKLRYR